MPDEFTHILRLLNTNVDGKEKIMYALTSIKGIGRRFANLACKKAEVNLRKRAGECFASGRPGVQAWLSFPQHGVATQGGAPSNTQRPVLVAHGPPRSGLEA